MGVPEITPVLAPRASPAGNDPVATDHVYTPVPPVALSVALYAVPCVPVGSVAVVITGACATGVTAVASACISDADNARL